MTNNPVNLLYTTKFTINQIQSGISSRVQEFYIAMQNDCPKKEHC